MDGWPMESFRHSARKLAAAWEFKDLAPQRWQPSFLTAHFSETINIFYLSNKLLSREVAGR